MARKDFYKTLGVSKDATEDEIKRAYRKLARKYHPDVNPGDKASEEKFKEISEAHEVLTDKEKRAQYDQFGDSPFGGGGQQSWGGGGYNAGGFDFGDIFGNIFGQGGGQPRGPRKGADLEYELEVSFTEAILGAQKEISVRRNASCASCGGSGHEPSGGGQRCPQCQGSGRVSMKLGPMTSQQPCPSCGGTGRAQGPTCKGCGGSGKTPKSERLRVKIPPGVETGSKVRIAGKGEGGAAGDGDMLIRIKVAPDSRFSRQGNDIVAEVEVPLADALLGGHTLVPTLTEQVKMKIPAGTQNGQRFRIKGKGVPGKGDLFASIKVKVPKNLSAKAKETLESLRDELKG
ncbi:MAG: molecular chaperone DnaJ [Deltaproteobacteria bacterium]|nr:MAG: molecular chaperone DnaJ [Deltaproteobacteria bacterium]